MPRKRELKQVYVFMVRKRDLKQVDAITREFKMGGELRIAFGLFLEEEKKNGYGGTFNRRGDFTYEELRQKAKEFLEELYSGSQ